MKLVREMDPNRSAGGTVSYQAYTDDGRWVGWVFDGREWHGSRYGRQQWHAAWREQGDTAARANTNDLPPMWTRRQAVEWLEATVSGAQTNRQ